MLALCKQKPVAHNYAFDDSSVGETHKNEKLPALVASPTPRGYCSYDGSKLRLCLAACTRAAVALEM